MEPSNFRIILWDFDGVIIDSNPAREFGFREVLKDYPNEQVEQLVDFHNANGGWSRYVKFRYFFEEIRGESISDKHVNELAGQFSILMRNLLVNPELLIEDTINYLADLHSLGREMHIVSGSDGIELKWLCRALGIDHYFKSINGSPKAKVELVREILDVSTQDISEFCLIGDAKNDFDAANGNGITFFGYNNPSLLGLENYLIL